LNLLMPISLPHNFPSLYDGQRKPVIIIGAGLSRNLTPTPKELFIKKCQSAATELECPSIFDYSNPDNKKLYIWAEEAIKCLNSNGEEVPKLRVAEKLGLLSDMCWQGTITMRACMNNPVHRVIARFVREERWRALWSLNWDTHFEAALDSIGMKPISTEAPVPPNDLPWRRNYKTFITKNDYPVPDDTFILHKPHGCIIALLEAQKALNNGDVSTAKSMSDRFLIANDELSLLEKRDTPEDHNFFANIREKFSSRPLYCVGWSASEKYITDFLSEICDQLRSGEDDSLCIIDPNFDLGHTKLIEIYNKTEEQSHIKISNELSTDNLFLWIQSKYALMKLKNYAPMSLRTVIQDAIDELGTPNPASQSIYYDFVDYFMPTWIRLCWRAGLVSCIKGNGDPIRPHDIRLESSDEHIPFNIPNSDRPDMKALAILLPHLCFEDNWLDFKSYLGGLYRKTDKTLIVPLPAWQLNYNNLEGIKPLIQDITQRGLGFIEELAVLPLSFDIASIDPDASYVLPQKLAREIGSISFSREGAINVISLEEITGGR
jgi:hypothetical protein